MAQVASPQGKEEKKEDRGLFLQVPYHIIDHLDMTDNAKIGFIRFCRLFNKKDKTIEFRGYYRGLASALRKSPAHTISIVDQWVQFDLVQREETIDGVILKVNTSAIWEKNKIDRKTQQCLNYEQQSLYNSENESSAVQDINAAIQNINTAVYKINAAIQNMNSDERKNALTRLLDITRLLDLKDEGQNHNEQPSGYANATPPCLHPFQLIDFNSPLDNSSFAYSHNTTPTTSSQASQETGSSAVGAGYTNGQSSVKQPEKPTKGTKRTKKEKVVQPALVDTNKKAVAYNEAEQQQFDWYCGCDFIHARPEQDANKKAHCGKLIAHVHSQEDMQSLADFTKARLSQQLQRDVYIAQLGNMANGDNLNAWIASRQKPQQTGKVIDFQQKTTQARPGSWRERFENDPNNGGYNDEASIEAFIKAGEEIANAAV